MTSKTGNGNNQIQLGDGDDKPYLIWEKHWLKEWGNLDVSDKKVLAALYWDDLTDNQRHEFTDYEYIEFQKIKARKHAEMVSNPVLLKQHFLESAAPIIDEMIAAAKGETKRKKTDDEYALRQVWDVLKTVIQQANNPSPMIDLKGKSIDEQINKILTSVSEGRITIEAAKDYMSLVSTGFNLQQLPKLMEQLEALESS